MVGLKKKKKKTKTVVPRREHIKGFFLIQCIYLSNLGEYILKSWAFRGMYILPGKTDNSYWTVVTDRCDELFKSRMLFIVYFAIRFDGLLDEYKNEYVYR